MSDYYLATNPYSSEYTGWYYQTDFEYLVDPLVEQIVVVGARGEDLMLRLLLAGIDPARIIVEGRALNTVQNIQFSKQLMASPDAPAALVTNNFHVTRAAALARKQGLTNVYAIAAPSDPAYLPNNMFREFFGLTKDFLAGNL